MTQQSLLPSEPCYLLDSSIINELTRRAFPASKYPQLHAELNRLIEEGRIKSVEEVKREFEDGTQKQPDVPLRWCNDHKNIFLPIDEHTDVAMGTVTEYFQLDVLKADTAYADPHLVASALAHGNIVVTAESTSPNPNKPRIPEVCAKLDIRCIDIWQFLREVELLGLAVSSEQPVDDKFVV